MAQEFAAPSGVELRLYDVIIEPAADLVRFRFLAPALDPAGTAVPQGAIAGDFVWLCETLALPALTANGQNVAHVVISLSDREVAFGTAAPDATQYFDAFAVDGSQCLWEPF